MQSDVSAVVTSFNRIEHLRETLDHLTRDTAVAEIIVCDDGSTDGSVDMVRCTYPDVRLIANETGVSRGVVVQMHLGYMAATQPFILSIDEDLILGNEDTTRWIRSYFEDPEVGLVAVPFIDVLRDERVQNASPHADTPAHRHAHIGAGVMLRRQAYIDVGGYGLWLENYREEAELSLLMMAHGLQVLVPPAKYVARHMRRPGALGETARFRSARNDMLFYWRYTPGLKWIPFVVATAIRNIADGLRESALGPRLRGLIAAWPHARQAGLTRNPVHSSAFQRFRTLKSKGPVLCDHRS